MKKLFLISLILSLMALIGCAPQTATVEQDGDQLTITVAQDGPLYNVRMTGTNARTDDERCDEVGETTLTCDLEDVLEPTEIKVTIYDEFSCFITGFTRQDDLLSGKIYPCV